MRLSLCVGAATAALLLSSTAASAAQLLIVNADFNEGPAAAFDGAYVAGHQGGFPGWISGGSGTGHWNPSAAHIANEAEYGATAYVTGILRLQPSAGHLAQTVADYVIKANTRYTLTLDVGRYFGQNTFGYDFGLLAGDFASGAQILARLEGSTNAAGAPLPEGSFQTLNLVFETGASDLAIGKALTIALGSNDGGIAYDNVRLDATSLSAAVPEPATWTMLIFGFSLSGSLIRRRQSALARI